jgi:hypothetical protein
LIQVLQFAKSQGASKIEWWWRRIHLCYALHGINTWCLSTAMVIVIDSQLFQLKQRQTIISGNPTRLGKSWPCATAGVMVSGKIKKLRLQNKSTLGAQSSFKSWQLSMCQEIQFSLKINIYYHVHKIQKMNRMLSELNSNHNFLTYFLNIHFNIIIPTK